MEERRGPALPSGGWFPGLLLGVGLMYFNGGSAASHVGSEMGAIEGILQRWVAYQEEGHGPGKGRGHSGQEATNTRESLGTSTAKDKSRMASPAKKRRLSAAQVGHAQNPRAVTASDQALHKLKEEDVWDLSSPSAPMRDQSSRRDPLLQKMLERAAPVLAEADADRRYWDWGRQIEQRKGWEVENRKTGEFSDSSAGIRWG